MTVYRPILYFCKKCDNEVHEDHNYCFKCGKKLCQIRFAKIQPYKYGR